MTDLTSTQRPENKPWFWVPVHPATMGKIWGDMGIQPPADLTAHRLLDFGCGSGRYLSAFSEFFPAHNLYGVDTDADALAHVRELGFEGRILNPAQAVLPYEDQFFDYVFSSNVIEHIPRPVYLQYLAEIKRVLKPGGIFAVGAPNYPFKRVYDLFKAFRQKTPEERRYYLFDDPTHCHKVSILTVEKDLARHFEQVNLRPSVILGQKKFKFMRKPEFQVQFRVLGDKFFGTCRKPQA